VRDYYNFAVQQAVMLLFRSAKDNEGTHPAPRDDIDREWSVTFDQRESPLPLSGAQPTEILPASTLAFDGIRNQYRRDGLGAEMVAVMPKGERNVPWAEMRYPALTVILDFPGETMEHVLARKETVLHVYDPFRTERVTLRGIPVPLAGNFTSGYGLWLARSFFARQSLGTLIGKGNMLKRPRVYLMQPYQPDKKTIIMVHGLASSPEAWINVANEIMGDEKLARSCQIWQIYYPTSFPLAVSNFEIRKALSQTIAAFDPNGEDAATHDMLIVGHSMGGILARLMVSSSGNKLWDALAEKRGLKGDRRHKVKERFHDYLFFEPVPQIGRAIFIAAPHRGTPFADNSLARLAAGLVTLPVHLIRDVIQPALALLTPEQASRPVHSFNGITNLSTHDAFIQASAKLPIASSVSFHSIIGNNTPGVPLEKSNDGIVPYSSAHLEGASSEKVIVSGHSVQETPQGILELRRIIHEHLRGHADRAARSSRNE
jgi:pimeloyl-ACP methyl ester carboxylesterase